MDPIFSTDLLLQGETIDVYGPLPDGFAIDGVAARVTTPVSGVTATSVIDQDRFVVTLSRANGAITATTVELKFLVGARPGPAVTQPLTFGSTGAGGSGTSPDQLRPGTPTVSLTITSAPTGDQDGPLGSDPLVRFTNASSMQVTIGASAHPGTIGDVTVTRAGDTWCCGGGPA